MIRFSGLTSSGGRLLLPLAGILCLAAGGVSSCSRRPSGVLDEEAMTSLLADMYKAEAYAATDPDFALNDSMRPALRRRVLTDHHSDEAAFNRSLDWYGHNMDRLGDIYDGVSERLSSEAASSGNVASAGAGSASSSASDNLWTGQRRVALTPFTGTSRISFQAEGSRVKPSHNEIVWEYTVPVLPGRITAFLGADFADGTVAYATQTRNSSGAGQLILPLTPGKKLRRVFGQATYIPVRSETVFIDSIRVISRPSRTPGHIPAQSY